MSTGNIESAFPIPHDDSPGAYPAEPGMTLRDYAAAEANGLRIKYRLRIECAEVIPVEQIIAKVESIGEGYHEEIADDLLLSFGGLQMLVADHHGVIIETMRLAPADTQPQGSNV